MMEAVSNQPPGVAGAYARILAHRMSEISEETWCAGWMMGLEFELWGELHGDKDRFMLNDNSAEELRALSEQCGGWIVFDDTTWETFVPLAMWVERYKRKRST